MDQLNQEQGWWLELPAEWRAPLRGEDGMEREVPLREHPALRKYASKDEAVKALVHAQRMLGRRPEGYVRVPGTDAAPEEQAEFRAALGLPEAPDGYGLPEVELPEGFELREELRNAYLTKAYELGLTPAQVSGLFEWFVPLNVEAAQELGSETERRRSGELESLRSVHRGETRSVLEAARQAALALGGEELVHALDETGAADRAVVVNALSRLAPVMLEGRFRFRDAGGVQGLTLNKLKEMMRDPRYQDPLQRDPEFVAQVTKGFEMLFPGKYEPGTRV
ncbi:MAG: hypothetical protein AB7E32_04110 [Desulfovibrio sp.]